MRVDLQDQVVQDYLTHESEELEHLIESCVQSEENSQDSPPESYSFPFIEDLQAQILEDVKFIIECNVGGPLVSDIQTGIRGLSDVMLEMNREELSQQDRKELLVRVLRNTRLIYNQAGSLAEHLRKVEGFKDET